MAEAGILNEDDRVELIGGEIIAMTPIGPRHAFVVDWLVRAFLESVGGRAAIRTQNPTILDDLSEPQPDIAIATGPLERYRSRHPRPRDLLLVIEVCDATAAIDRNIKIPRYALTGVPETWLVDLDSDRVDVFRVPRPDGYGSASTYGLGEHITPEAFPDVVFDVGDVLGLR